MSMHATIAPAYPNPVPFIATVPSPASAFEDPLDEDSADDAVVPTTRRGLVRIALIAAETAGRFQREDVDVDPMAWMLAPRRLFDGATALDACVGRDACVRALLLHGLGMGLDADPAEVDALAEDDVDADDAVVRAAEPSDLSDGAVQALRAGGEEPCRPGPALYTSTMVAETTEGVMHVFDAVVADGRAEAMAALRLRHGARLAERANLVRGFRPHLPLIQALVSPAMEDMLVQVERDPTSPLARGLIVSVEQRFAA